MKKVLSIILMLMCISFGASAAVKCKAITQKGTQCTRVAKKDGYCTQHYNMHHSGKPTNGAQCKAITKSGSRCSRKAVTDGFCTQHYKIEQFNKKDPNFKKKVEACYDANGKPLKASKDAERCQSPTKDGDRCKLKAIEGYTSCPVHFKY
ncbi:MAG: hypothetical protein J5629_11875 [Muribaculaceae bacterium]|nr:hypothetical protein [Muribaculaceae bacterium]